MTNWHGSRLGRRPGAMTGQNRLLWAFALASGLMTATGQAEPHEPPEEQLVLAQLDYEKSQGLKSYVALREIWKLWENVEPLLVEEALLLAAEDKSKPGHVRDYAKTLSAYARLRRGDLKTPGRIFSEQGYVTDWLVVGPFDNEGKGGFSQIYGPDADPTEPIIPGQAFSGKERPVRYRTLPRVFNYGWVDFGNLMRPSTHICAHATTFISDPTLLEKSVHEKGKPGALDRPRTRKITLSVGSDGAHRVTFNGRVLIEEEAYRGFDTGRTTQTAVLLPGQNRLSVKVCGADNSPMFALRLADENGIADPLLKSTTAFQASEEAKVNVEKSAADGSLPPKAQGPLALVKAIEDNTAARAEDLELAARYLVITGGDDETRHQARDLAKRASDKSPSISRLLLLAELSEDRNTEGDALSKAEKLSDGQDIKVLLARAAHKRSGPSAHEAFPIYDQVLALDPDNLTALQGRVELYNAAGLRQTALSTLEAAYSRRPHSVLLSNMVASQRSSLGLSRSAAEAEDRYAFGRFDDNSYLTGRMELAIARDDRRSALHYLKRLRDSDPQSLWVYSVAARVHRALGDRKGAIAALESARQMAPEDVGVLQNLADLQGRMGDREQQLSLLQEVLRLRPQEVDVRKYVEHIEPPELPADEKYAMPSDEFLKRRHKAAEGYPQRTLQDLTVSTVYQNGLSSQFRQVVFQPLTDAAAAIGRQYAFQYQADRQRVQLKGARVYRADGSIDEAIESGEAAANDPSISMYTSARTYYVQFPRLEPGDVVELRYRVDDITVRNEFSDYFGDITYMQSDEPIAHAKYVLVTPKSRKLLIDAKVPNLKQTVKEKGHDRIYEFVATDVPALRPEPMMPPWSELLGFVHVSTYESWDALGKWYWGLIQEQLDLDDDTRKKLQEITANAVTTEDKVKAVYAWVIKNTRYVALEFGIYGYKPRRCVQTVNRGWGDCKDKATVIVTFLRELGIDAHLVVLRTGMRGDFRSELPSLAPFDHAIAHVPALNLYLDGTAEHTGIYELPVMDQGALGLLVLDGKAKLVRLPPPDPAKNVITRTTTATVLADGSAKLDSAYEITGHGAPGFRAQYESAATRKDRLATAVGSLYPGIALEEQKIKTSDLSDAEAPARIEFAGAVPRFARKEGDTLSLPVTVQTRLAPHYAALSSRTQDVRIQGFSTLKERVTLTLPHGTKISAQPPETTYESPFGTYGVKVQREGEKIVVESYLSLKVDRVTKADYSAFREFCIRADQALSHRLVVTP